MKPAVQFRRRRSSWVPRAIAIAAVLIAASLAPRIAVAGCTEDAAGMCERPIACTPPQGGKCTTVAIPQPLTGHKFECRCLAPKTTTGVIGGLPPGGGHTGGLPPGGGQSCQQKCAIARGQCLQRARSPAEQSLCAQQFQRCEQACQSER
jgi:hypothetical protein